MSKKVKRLYESFKPDHYQINIVLSQDKQSFSGSVRINGKKTSRPSNRITLHQNKLKITKAEIFVKNKKSNELENIDVTRITQQQTYNELRLHTENTLYPGDYEIYVEYSGKVTKNMDGIYPCFFEDNGVKKSLIASQFESHHARDAFPCIDEPEAKATFQLTLTHDANEVALSNTPVINEKIDGDRKVTSFDKTPIMSTYLVAFVVGDLEYREATSGRGVKIRTYATPQHAENTDFALSVAVKAMDFYEDYYDIPFPLEKCDFVALPDFASGAMENWGLITFREQLMICDEHTSLNTKQYIAIVVCHELTHQWFGNLVTMRWWTDLWLNEGFASWMEYLAVDELFPEWKVWSQFSVDEQQSALRADALEHTHPIEVTVNHPDEIRTIFDIISYQKGASVIHMLQHYLGATDFRDGLRHYLKTHAYKNTDTVDLWQALEQVSKKPVTAFMGAWTQHPGFPIVHVELLDNKLSLSQSRFVTNPKSEARADKTLWPVPLLAPELEGQVLEKKTAKIELDAAAFVKLNVGQTGFYRAYYDAASIELQRRALEAGTLEDNDRMGLLSDSFEATRAGYQSVSAFLDLLMQYRDESSLAVWEIIATSLSAIRQTLSKNELDNTLRDQMKPFIQKLTAAQLTRLGWELKDDEDHLDTLLRPLIISLAASADEPSIITRCLDAYNQKIKHDTPVDPDLRGIIYSVAARKGGNEEFNQLLKLYKSSSSADEKLSITAALTSFEQPELHTRILELLKTDTVRLQDTAYWVAYSLMNRHSRIITWKWVQANWDWLKANLGTDLSFYRTPVYVARNFNTEALLKEYMEFFSARMEPVLERTYKQGIEMIETASGWHSRDTVAAHQWFSDNSKKL